MFYFTPIRRKVENIWYFTAKSFYSSELYLPDDILEKMIAEDILRELSKEEKIFFRDEFCGPKSDKLQDNAKTCKKYRLRRKLERKMDEADFYPGSEW